MPRKAPPPAPAWSEPFLELLRAGEQVQDACKAVGITKQRAYQIRDRDSAFRAAWADAYAEGRPRAAARAAAKTVPVVIEPQPWYPALLEALRAGKTVREACQAAGVSITVARQARRRDPEFRAAWADARTTRPNWHDPFLATLRGGSRVADALEEAGITWPTLVKARRQDPAFAQAYQQALREGRSARWKTTFLATLQAAGSVPAACEAAAVAPRTARAARRRDPAFAQAWDQAYALSPMAGKREHSRGS